MASHKLESSLVRNMYEPSNWGGEIQRVYNFIWHCSARKKARIFAWLMVRRRIKVRSVLLREYIVPRPFDCSDSEAMYHFVVFPRIVQILNKLGTGLNGLEEPSDIENLRNDCHLYLLDYLACKE